MKPPADREVPVSSSDAMGDRLKEYERHSEQVLPRRLPVILRLDGNNFSRLTGGSSFQKPFDARFEYALEEAAKSVLEYCSGEQLAYLQSDEITLLLRNDQNRETDPFLANRTQKLTSLTAARASVAFNQALAEKGIQASAIFDCRAFVVPYSEVVNVFLWRQFDCRRNAVSSLAYWGLRNQEGRKTAQKRLHGMSQEDRKTLLADELNLPLDEVPTHRLRGRAIYEETVQMPIEEALGEDKFRKLAQKGHVEAGQRVQRGQWVVDREMPDLLEDRSYITRFLPEPMQSSS